MSEFYIYHKKCVFMSINFRPIRSDITFIIGNAYLPLEILDLTLHLSYIDAYRLFYYFFLRRYSNAYDT